MSLFFNNPRLENDGVPALQRLDVPPDVEG